MQHMGAGGRDEILPIAHELCHKNLRMERAGRPVGPALRPLLAVLNPSSNGVRSALDEPPRGLLPVGGALLL